MEQLNLIPELTLTAPTPDSGNSTHFLSGSGSQAKPVLFEDSVDRTLRQQTNPETATLKTSDLGFTFLDLNHANLDLALGFDQGSPGTSSRNNSEPREDKDALANKGALGISDKRSGTRRASNFRWSTLRVDENAKENVPPDKTGGAWKRFSRILDSISAPTGRRHSVLGSSAQPLSDVNDTSCQSPSRLSSPVQRSDYTMASKRGSGLSAPATSVCIHEEGEHAASRLFGLPSTGLGAKRPKNEIPKVGDATGLQAKRRSFGFNVKGFRNRRRHIEEGAE